MAVTVIATAVAASAGVFAAWEGRDNVVSTYTMVLSLIGVGLAVAQHSTAARRHTQGSLRQVGHLLVAAMVVATCYATWVVSQRPVIRIGVSMPFLAEDPQDALAVLNGVKLAVNAESDLGIGPHDIELVPFDDSNIGGGITLMSADGTADLRSGGSLGTLLADPRLVGIVGPFHSDTALDEISEVSAAGVPMISPSTTLNCLTARGETCERLATVPPDSTFFRMAVQDEVRVTELVAQLSGMKPAPAGGTRRVIVASDGSSFGNGFAATFTTKWKKEHPGDELENVSADRAVGLVRERSDAPALILYCGTGVKGVSLYRAMWQQPWAAKTIFAGPATLMNVGFSDPARTDGELYAIAPVPHDPANPYRSDFEASYQVKSGGKDATPYSAAAFDATRALIIAIRAAVRNGARPAVASIGPFVAAAGANLRRRITANLRTLNISNPGYQTPTTARFTFDARGDVVYDSDRRTATYRYESPGVWRIVTAIPAGPR
ncbi:hypothetical protein ACIA8K_32960 [Catenuloplanes sp. NPDC051500]|uniref:hypothetical protein n=1 Tax=Catenuloplanes sp. NPDC051500 TaxID=3363959 RepID=UPI0037B431DE